MSWLANASVPHGQHLCLPFETDDEKQEAVVSFLHEGLSHGARCLFIGTPSEFEDLGRQLEIEGLCTVRAQARGALEFMTPEAAYLHDGVFEPERVLARFTAMVERAVADGFTGLRGTGELMHLPSPEEWRKIVWYEAQVNEHFARLPFAGLCRYPRSIVPSDRVRDVLRTHPVAIVRGESCENPFYERTELALSDDSEARLDWQLYQLRAQNKAQRHLQGTTVSAVTAAVELATQLEELRAELRRSGTDH
jgi:hypothetical protein